MPKSPTELLDKKCHPYEAGMPPLAAEDMRDYLAVLPGWGVEGSALVRAFSFKNYYQTVAFVNALAWIAHREDHHPDISFGYKTAVVRFSTHSVGGLTENDFICAAKVDALLR
jgi:4a-hydroxytetrahydrobiopterin dehydratase